MSFKLPHLTQVVLLDRGQADLVHRAVYHVCKELLHRDPALKRWSPIEALTLTPLNHLRTRLLTLAERDELPVHVALHTKRRGGKPRPPKPNKLKVTYEEMTTVRYYYARLLATTSDEVDQLMLAGALAKFHQPSLGLEQHIALPSPTGPGCQLAFPVA
jgi:hypothetical protein